MHMQAQTAPSSMQTIGGQYELAQQQQQGGKMGTGTMGGMSM
jgi:hypothetical protein